MIREMLNNLIIQGKISMETLNIITKMDITVIEKYLSGSFAISSEDEHYLFYLASMLTSGMDAVEDDQRLSGIMDILIERYKLNYTSMSLYTGVSVEDIAAAHKQPQTVSLDIRYTLAVKLGMIYYTFGRREAL